MADAQADTAHGTEGAKAPDEPKTGQEQQQTVPMARFEQVIAELHGSRQELAAMKEQIAELKASHTPPPEPNPEPETEEDKRLAGIFKGAVDRAVDPLRKLVIAQADELDALRFRSDTENMDPADVKRAEEVRVELWKQGIPATRRKALALAMGEKMLDEREKAEREERSRQKANLAAITENRAPAARPEPLMNLESLPLEEQVKRISEYYGDAKF